MSLELTIDKLVAGSLQDSIAVKQRLLEDEGYQMRVTGLGHAMAQALASGHKIIFLATEEAPRMLNTWQRRRLGSI